MSCDCFTTIRLYTESKHHFYFKNKFKPFEVILNEEKLKEAVLIDVQQIKLKDLLNSGWSWVDAGLSNQDFYDLMFKFYGKKLEWNGSQTKMLLLFLKTIEVIEK